MGQNEADRHASDASAGFEREREACGTPLPPSQAKQPAGDETPCEASQRFWSIWQDVERIYERYARLQGLSYTSLTILGQVYDDRRVGAECTQRSICDATHLPKQTVNSVVSGLCRDGVVELVELPHDRRAKAIHLTEEGAIYARRLIEPVNEAERVAFSQLTETERAQFFDALSRFAASYAAQMRAFEEQGTPISEQES